MVYKTGQITVVLPMKEIDKIKRLARLNKLSMSEVIRRLIKQGETK